MTSVLTSFCIYIKGHNQELSDVCAVFVLYLRWRSWPRTRCLYLCWRSQPRTHSADFICLCWLHFICTLKVTTKNSVMSVLTHPSGWLWPHPRTWPFDCGTSETLHSLSTCFRVTHSEWFCNPLSQLGGEILDWFSAPENIRHFPRLRGDMVVQIDFFSLSNQDFAFRVIWKTFHCKFKKV